MAVDRNLPSVRHSGDVLILNHPEQEALAPAGHH
jgi:hypothetical protein